VDGNDMVNFGEGTPHLVGSGNNSQNLNLNRDAVRVDTVEVQGLYRTIFNRWDPTLIFDAHLMGRVQHGYANGYIHSTVAADDLGTGRGDLVERGEVRGQRVRAAEPARCRARSS
jgi:hypothetical protein